MRRGPGSGRRADRDPGDLGGIDRLLDLPAEGWISVDRLANNSWSVYASTAQQMNVGDDMPTIVQFDEVRDDGDLFELYRFQSSSGGPALICASYMVPVDSRLVVYRNSSAHAVLAHGTMNRLDGCTVVALDAGDRVDVRVVHRAGGERTFDPDPYARLTIDKIR